MPARREHIHVVVVERNFSRALRPVYDRQRIGVFLYHTKDILQFGTFPRYVRYGTHYNGTGIPTQFFSDRGVVRVHDLQSNLSLRF